MNKLNYDLLNKNEEYENNSETIAQEFIADLLDNIIEVEKIITEHNPRLRLTMQQFDYIKSMYGQLEDMETELNAILAESE